MRIRFSDLWRWDGVIGRGEYVLIGLLAFAVKHNLDIFVASHFFHRPWSIPSYWFPPVSAVFITALSPGDARFLAAMLAISLPFTWMGTVLTLRRLRDAGLPPGFVVVFFVPFLNVVFFALLSMVSSRTRPSHRSNWMSTVDQLVPENRTDSAISAVLVALLFGVTAIEICLFFFKQYGWGLFVALPFCMGLTSSLVHGYRRPRTYGACQMVALTSVALLGIGLLLMAFEGAVCLVMAMPIAMALASIGASIGYSIQRRPGRQALVASLTMFLVVSVPALMGAESILHLEPPRYEVHTAIEIDAPPSVVWKSLVAFPRISTPPQLLFRLGIAYPLEATLRGSGVGAMRECLFSTGTFVEVIDEWQEARLLKFSIAAQAEPMKELTPYPEIHPPHLEGYLHPQQAQFLLTPLPNGRTRLEGTSWYRNEMWPASYWKLWSDEIIHSVHSRVFEHVKRISEGQVGNLPH